MKNDHKPVHPALKICFAVSIIIFIIGTAGFVLTDTTDAFLNMAFLGAGGLLTIILIRLISVAIDTMKQYLGKDKITLRDFFAPLNFSTPLATRVMNYRRITAIVNLAFIPIDIISLANASILIIPIALHTVLSMAIMANVNPPYTEQEADVADMWETIIFYSVVLDGVSILVAMGLGSILGIS